MMDVYDETPNQGQIRCAGAAPVDSPRTGCRLKVGLLLGTTGQPRWHRKVIADLATSADCELALIVMARPGSPLARSSHGRRSWLYRIYRKIDRRLFRKGPDALDVVEVADLIEDCPAVEVKLRDGDESFEATDVERVSAYALDLILCLGPEPRGGRVARMARFGACAFRFGGAVSIDGEFPGVREVLGGLPATTASLNLLASDPGDEERPLYAATLKTDRLSSRRHVDHLGWVASEFVGRALRQIGQQGLPAPTPGSVAPPGQAIGLPGNAEMSRLMARFGGRLAAEGVRRALYSDQWVLGYSTLGVWDGQRPDLSTLRLVMPPADRFWADPFPIVIEGKTWVFFEDYPYETRKGLISVFEIDDHGQVGESRKALERDYHLSYPFVFAWGGALYMIPETTAAANVELYCCTRVPDHWEFDRVLIPGVRAADVTIAEHDGLWWLFACIPADGAHNDVEELHLFHAEGPLGPWRPHRGNPVKSDVGSARPAGRLYRRGESWYRPAQDCTLGYGHSIVLNRVLAWDVDRYDEEEAGRIPPGWAEGVDRTHTFNALGSLFVVDARVARPRFLPKGRGGVGIK